MKKFIIFGWSFASVLMSGCSLVPVALNAAGVGAATEPQIIADTAKQFGVASSLVTISDVTKDAGISGVRIFYSAKVAGKDFRCFLGSSMIADSLPTCAKPGEPLNVNS